MYALLTLLSAAAGADLRDELARFNTHADIPLPVLTESQLAVLSSGEIVRFIEPQSNDNLRVFGFAVLQAPMVSLYIASQHPRYASTATAMLTEYEISTSGDRGVWYGLIDLPRPFTDRHWVVNNWNNHAIAATTANVQWEHLWQLHPEGIEPARPAMARGEIGDIDAEQFNAAIALPVSEGGLVLINLGGGSTLVAVHSMLDLGGSVPERPLAEFARRSMTDYFVDLKARALTEVPQHYRAGVSASLIGADGQVIPYFE